MDGISLNHSASTNEGSPALTVVLDTNVWLDTLVFFDDQAHALHSALQKRKALIALNGSTLNELMHLLDRIECDEKMSVERRLRAQRAQACLDSLRSELGDICEPIIFSVALNKHDTHYNIVQFASIKSPSQQYPIDSIKLPHCKDQSDQKFLTLASQCSAALLITHDKALLKCRRYPLTLQSSPSHGLVTKPDRAIVHLGTDGL